MVAGHADASEDLDGVSTTRDAACGQKSLAMEAVALPMTPLSCFQATS